MMYRIRTYSKILVLEDLQGNQKMRNAKKINNLFRSPHIYSS